MSKDIQNQIDAPERSFSKSETLTEAQWRNRGMGLFGPNMLEWKFECPSCGRVQTPLDFKEFKDQGATPNDAYQRCRGRFTGGRKGPDKCDWAAFGLFLGPNFVIDSKGDKIPVFPFYEKGTGS